MLGEPPAPVADRRHTFGAQLAVVEHRISRTRRLRAVLDGAHRLYIDFPTDEPQYFERDFVPARAAGGRDVESTLGARLEQIARCPGDIPCPGRRADLIVHYAQASA